MEEDEAAIAAALSTAVGWNWTAPPHAVAPPLLRSDFDDEDAWKAHCRKRRAQQMALQEKSRAPRDRSNRTRPARVRQQEERRQQRERRDLEQRQLFCEAGHAQASAQTNCRYRHRLSPCYLLLLRQRRR